MDSHGLRLSTQDPPSPGGAMFQLEPIPEHRTTTRGASPSAPRGSQLPGVSSNSPRETSPRDSPRQLPQPGSPGGSMPFATTDSPQASRPRSLAREDSTGSTTNPLENGLRESGRERAGGAPLRGAHSEMSDYIAYYMQALQNNPTDPSLHNVLGVALAKQGDLDMAIKHYTTALELDMAFFPAHYNLGRARYRQGRVEEAVRHYEYSLRLNPDDKKAHNSLGIVLAEQGNVEEAISHFQEASRIMEGMLEMQPINQRFREPALEDEFTQRRTQQAMIPTRLLIIVSMVSTGVNFAYSMYDFIGEEHGGAGVVMLEQQVEQQTVGSVEDRSFGEHEELMFDSRLHALIYGVKFAVGLGTLGLTWHHAFYRSKPLGLTVYIIVYLLGVLTMAWLTLREEKGTILC